MGQRNDLQELIPESYREIVEAVPRGFPRSAVTDALLLGAYGVAGDRLRDAEVGWRD